MGVRAVPPRCDRGRLTPVRCPPASHQPDWLRSKVPEEDVQQQDVRSTFNDGGIHRGLLSDQLVPPICRGAPHPDCKHSIELWSVEVLPEPVPCARDTIQPVLLISPPSNS